ncbi:MAG: DUF2851 family protein, partial [Bacteroidaceae bacterium]|nr:DUF2851 family protein [Bacteroidaceae bacterium]
MEKLLHYVWMHKLLPSKEFITTDGQKIRILELGRHNANQGPDFCNARIEMEGMEWIGNVEIHSLSSDWARHGHHKDPVYNTTILHVVGKADAEAFMENGQRLPQIILDIPSALTNNYQELLHTTDYPRCHKFVPNIPSIKVHSWLDALLAERMEARAKRILDILQECRGDWEQTTFITLARNFGFGLNGDIFEMWAKRIPLSAAGKHRDNLFQLVSLFLGVAGLIDKVSNEEERDRLTAEYKFLAHKFSLPQAMETCNWHYLRTRPQNFPDVRLRQLAQLFHEGHCSMRSMLEAQSLKDIDNVLANAGISKTSRHLIVINTVVPLMFAYDIYRDSYEYRTIATDFLEQLPGEKNYILRQWQACGLKVGTAYDSQALIQLK